MHGSLALKNGTLYVGLQGGAAHVRPYDLDGHPRGPGFSLRGEDGKRATIVGLTVDADHRIWVADEAATCIRAFTAFGRELPGLAGREPPEVDRPGHLGRLTDVACGGVEEEAWICAASGGRRRHALQVFDRGGRCRSLRPEGDPRGEFRGIARVGIREAMIWVCEPGRERVQVFRHGEFHFLFHVAVGSGGVRFEPRAIAPLSDGRLVLAQGGAHSALLVLDSSGCLLRVIAEAGSDGGEVSEPSDLEVDEHEQESRTRIAVIDRDGDRVQVFTLAGRCFGSFGGLSLSAP